MELVHGSLKLRVGKVSGLSRVGRSNIYVSMLRH